MRDTGMHIYKKTIFWCAILLSIMASCSSCASENCTFSDELISGKQFFGNNSIATFQWFPKSNEAKGVLVNGNLFSVKYWSCNHYGKQAIMVIGPQMQTYPDELNDYVMQLGKLALDNVELQLLKNSLKSKLLKISDSPIMLRIQSKEYDEFYIKIDIVGEAIFIEIKLYKA